MYSVQVQCTVYTVSRQKNRILSCLEETVCLKQSDFKCGRRMYKLSKQKLKEAVTQELIRRIYTWKRRQRSWLLGGQKCFITCRASYFAPRLVEEYRLISILFFNLSRCRSAYSSYSPGENIQRGKELKQFCPPSSSNELSPSLRYKPLFFAQELQYRSTGRQIYEREWERTKRKTGRKRRKIHSRLFTNRLSIHC